jgi:hypothetical protein
MNLSVSRILLILSLLVQVFVSSCSKSSDSTPAQPDDPQLIGTWQGTTSQGLPIRLSVSNFDGLLIINTYQYDVRKYLTDTTWQEMNYNVPNSTVVTSVVQKVFAFRPYGGYAYTDYLKGTFDTEKMILTGRFNTSFPNQTGTALDSVTGSYSASRVK